MPNTNDNIRNMEQNPVNITNETATGSPVHIPFTAREYDVEQKFLETLKELKYKYREDIRNIEALKQNFKVKFEELNKESLKGRKLSDREFNRLLEKICVNDTFECSKQLREKVQVQIASGNGEAIETINCDLVNTRDWCKNEYEVVNQIKLNTSNSFHRYDVVILINGLPLVHIELKDSDVDHRKALSQIHRYKSETAPFAQSLFCFTQLYIVSNETMTCYFTNNNIEYFDFDAKEQFLPVYTYADVMNNKIVNLYSFAKTFLQKCRLGEMIGKYMVLVQTEKRLLMMRPYQIYAVESIVKSVEANNGNGYIWHTTGSGKTLTSFKAATLLKYNPNIEKCLFVVDRKDLDRQTRDEFNKFQEGCVEANINTSQLVDRLVSRDYKDKIIVTTIQKLGRALNDANGDNDYRKKLQPLSQSRVVFIFDECHRSQFGENHRAITNFFPKAQLFGFTGTPIFQENASQLFVEKKNNRHEQQYNTTKSIFGNLLHKYTITHAIADQNVLGFNISYLRTNNTPENQPTSRENQIAIIKAILKSHDRLTHNRAFNAMFATASIDNAIEYYKLFNEIQAEEAEKDPKFKPLKIACIFSPPANLVNNTDVIWQMQEDLEQEMQDNKVEPNKKRDALTEIITDYNSKYGTNHSINEFDTYYSDLQKRIKNQRYITKIDNRELIDVTIVVDMLLTGFDSKTLNTLYVDKKLRYHGLIQAFSRTNRVLNVNKPFGNIYDFRWQEQYINDAITLFSGEEPNSVRQLWIVEPPAEKIKKLVDINERKKQFFEERNIDPESPNAYAQLNGDIEKMEFISIQKELIKQRQELEQYIDITPEEEEQINEILPKDRIDAERRIYLEVAKTIIKERANNEEDLINNTAEQLALEFEYVVFTNATINYDYIMQLVSNLTKYDIKEYTKEEIINIIRSDSQFIDNGDELVDFIDSLETNKGFEVEELKAMYNTFLFNRFQETLKNIAKEFNIHYQDLSTFTDTIVRRGNVNYTSFEDDLSKMFANAGIMGEESWEPKEKILAKLYPHLIKITKKHIIGYDRLLQ